MSRFLFLAFRSVVGTVCFGVLFLSCAALAQTSGLLRLQQIQVTHGGPLQFSFNDYGTGATNYVVEFAPAIDTNDWQVASNAVVTSQTDGSYSVQIANPSGTKGFYRVNGLGGTNGGVVVTFSTTAFQVVEGNTVNTTLVLSQPYHGWIYYTVNGSAGTGDYQPLSGSNYVDGTTATIPVSFTDNSQISQLKYLNIILQASAGYTVGNSPSTSITINENDSAWQGTFVADNATLGFALNIDNLNGAYQATLKGDGTGFFPTNAVPATITLTPNSFAVAASSIPVAANATSLNIPANVTLLLNAMNGVSGQIVSGTQIQGSAELIAQYTGQPQLNTTNAGTFVLFKPPTAPSTNQVQLTTAP